MMNYVYRMDLPTSIPTESRGPELERDSEIAELTGIWPDPRYFISLAETKEMIRGVQAGDVGGAEALIATRLRWINDRYAQTDAVAARNDLELADIMHAGGLATIRVAEKIDAGSLESSSYLHSPIVHSLDSMLDNGKELFEPSRLLYGLMEAGKLLPTVRPDGSMPLYQVAEEQQEAAAGRHVIANGLRRGEILAMARDRSDGADVQPSAEAAAIDRAVMETALGVLKRLDERRRYIAAARFGFHGPVETQQQVADRLGGVSRTRIGQIEEGLIANLRVNRGLTAIVDIEHHELDNAQNWYW